MPRARPVEQSGLGPGQPATPDTMATSWRSEGPWLWTTAIGVRTSLQHRDVTFGGSRGGGIRVDSNEPVRFGFLRIPALCVTVEDLEGFAAARAERGIHEEDARMQRAMQRSGRTVGPAARSS